MLIPILRAAHIAGVQPDSLYYRTSSRATKPVPRYFLKTPEGWRIDTEDEMWKVYVSLQSQKRAKVPGANYQTVQMMGILDKVLAEELGVKKAARIKKLFLERLPE